VANTGPSVPSSEVERLLQPFQRLASTRGNDGDGHGLGLSIVAAIASAHDATLAAEPVSSGGLRIAVRFPELPDGRGDHPERFGRQSSARRDPDGALALLEREAEPVL
jgi:signal transduction histidine kinase